MLINEAVKKALQTGGCITRENAFWGESIKVKPTNTPDCCVVFKENKAVCPGWQPQAKDLIADDWTVLK